VVVFGAELELLQFVFENSRKKENFWIKGHAGCGKSVLLYTF
jgi:ABC-type lipoprotein export system ATPase subunit